MVETLEIQEAEKKFIDLKNQLAQQRLLIKSLKVPKTSSEALNLDEKLARRMYKNFSSEIQRILEKKFGKNFYNKKASEFINGYQDICDEIGVSSDDNEIIVEAPDLNDIEIKIVKTFIKKMRISKVYNHGKLPTKKDKRYYYWHELYNSAPSGLRCLSSGYADGDAHAASAAHLSFLEEESAKDVGKKFLDIDADFYHLR